MQLLKPHYTDLHRVEISSASAVVLHFTQCCSKVFSDFNYVEFALLELTILYRFLAMPSVNLSDFSFSVICLATVFWAVLAS